MRLVFPAYVPGVEGLTAALRAVARQGVDAVELGFGARAYFEKDDPRQLRAVQETLRETGIRPNSLHTLFGARYDIATLDPQVRAETLAMQRRAVSVAHALGAPYVIIHPGHGPRGERMPERLAAAVDLLRELEPLARAAGVTLAVENLPPEYPGGSADEVLSLVDAVASPWVAVCFDSGHAHLTGDLPGMARALLPRAVTMHLHDNEGTEDQHLLPGFGKIDWEEFARIYRESGCAAPGLLECGPPEGWTWAQCRTHVESFLRLRG